MNGKGSVLQAGYFLLPMVSIPNELTVLVLFESQTIVFSEAGSYSPEASLIPGYQSQV